MEQLSPCLFVAGILAVLSGCAAPALVDTRVNTTASNSYQLGPDERVWDCARFKSQLDESVKQLATLQEKITKELSEPPTTMGRLYQRSMGQTATDFDGEYKKVRVRAEAYNAELRTKHCAAIDLDAAIAAALVANKEAKDLAAKPATKPTEHQHTKGGKAGP